MVIRQTRVCHGDGVSDRRADGRPFEFRGGDARRQAKTCDCSRRCSTLRSRDQELRSEAAAENAPDARCVTVTRLKKIAAGGSKGDANYLRSR